MRVFGPFIHVLPLREKGFHGGAARHVMAERGKGGGGVEAERRGVGDGGEEGRDREKSKETGRKG